jgi:hypothetical protein
VIISRTGFFLLILLCSLTMQSCDPGLIWENPYDAEGENYPLATISPDEIKLHRYQLTNTAEIVIKNSGTGLLTWSIDYPNWIMVEPEAGSLTAGEFTSTIVKLAITDPPVTGSLTILTNSRNSNQTAKTISISVEAF